MGLLLHLSISAVFIATVLFAVVDEEVDNQLISPLIGIPSKAIVDTDLSLVPAAAAFPEDATAVSPVIRADSVVVGGLFQYQLLERISPAELPSIETFISDSKSDTTGLLQLLAPPAQHYMTPWSNAVDPDKLNEGKYHLRNRFAKGNNGEVWHATGVRLSDIQSGNQHVHVEDFVLKRLFVERGDHVRRSGERERFFGTQLKGNREAVRFVESFNRTVVSEGIETQELWLVFRYEGKSLDALLYNPVAALGSVIMEPSPFWQSLRRGQPGALTRREILRQLLEGIALLGDELVTHRDIKPSNLLVNEGEETPRIKIGDFGSAVHTASRLVNQELYHNEAIDQRQETRDYEPPEAIMNPTESFPYFDTSEYAVSPELLHSFDIWSCGVVALELLLGDDGKVFAVNSRRRRLVDVELDRKYNNKDVLITKEVRERSYYAASLGEFGISPSGMDKTKFNNTVTALDPYKRGFYDYFELGEAHLDLVFQMLQWHPDQRATAKELLQHAYFQLEV